MIRPSTDLLNSDVAIRKLLLNVSESYVDIPSASVRGCLSSISNIDSRLIVFVNYY